MVGLPSHTTIDFRACERLPSLRITNYKLRIHNKKPSLHHTETDISAVPLCLAWIDHARSCHVTVGGRLILRGLAYSPSLSGQPLGGETRRLSDRLAPYGGSLHGLGGEIPRQRVLGAFRTTGIL